MAGVVRNLRAKKSPCPIARARSAVRLRGVNESGWPPASVWSHSSYVSCRGEHASRSNIGDVAAG